MLKKIARSTVLTSAVAIATLLGTASAAHAGDVSGACTSDGYSATGWVYYHYVSSVARDEIDKFTWQINGQSGSTLNDVIIELKRDVNNAPDTVHYTWSTRSAKNGSGSHDPSATVRVPGSYNTYGRFHFIFDINNQADPDCHATTSRF
jgi:hypothetical protein